MGPLTKDLISAIHGHEDWNKELQETAHKISKGNFRAIENMSSWWGTYGTLNDIVITQLSEQETFESANNQFNELSGKVSSLRGSVIKNAVFD